MGKPEDEVQKKLIQLESQLAAEDASGLLATINKTELSVTDAIPSKPSKPTEPMESDMYMLGGIGLIVVGFLVVFSHVKVGTGFLAGLWGGFGGGGIGFLLMPLLVGIAMLFYNYRSRMAWIVTAASLLLILIEIFSSLTFMFPYVSLIQLILMLVPITAGCAMVAKAIQRRRSLQDKAR